MSTSYLIQIQTVRLDAQGNGTVYLKPDANQYWSPLFVKVGTRSTVSPVPFAAVYLGVAGVTPSQTEFIDDTYLGNGDVTSMCSGLVVPFGNALIAVFTGGNPGDTAFMQVIGMNSSVAPNLGIAPQVPGTHFTGRLTLEVSSTLLASGALTTIAAGATVTIPTTRAYDMRPFAGYYFRIFPFAATANLDMVTVNVIWTANPDGTVTIMQESYQFFASTTAFASGVMFLQDAVHGPFMKVQIVNNAGADTLDIGFTTLFGTTRTMPSPIAMQDADSDGVLAHTINQAIPGGGVLTVPCLYYHGTTKFVFHNAGAAAMIFSPNPGTLGTFEGYTLAAGATQVVNIITPRRATRVDVAGTVAQLASVEAYALLDKVN